MKLADDDIEQRRPVWDAFSEFFLDTELDAQDHERIAAVLAASHYSLHELEQILGREVYPVLIPNLHSVAGEWAGFDSAALQEAILRYARRRFKLPPWLHFSRRMIRDHWQKVRRMVIELRNRGSARAAP